MGFKGSGLLTDSYHFSMVQAYLANRMTDTAVFEFFARKLPETRNFLVAAGLEQLLEYLESLRFTREEVDWLRQTGRFQPEILDYLREFRFTGDVDALPEGTPFFPDEPVVRVTAPLPEAQLIESRLINLIHFETVIASKAARAPLVAENKLLVDFGMRRSHGSEAALLAARASYIGGYSATSTVWAGQLFQIPVAGTMAHSFIQAHENEELAFENFARSQTGPITLLIDTYDTESAASKVTELAPRLSARGIRIQGVRLDSGDLEAHARKVRAILDEKGLQSIRIFVSGNLDENVIQALLRSGAPIDGFGVGTRLTTSADAPYLDCAYKLQEYAGKARRKKSEAKATWPGRKQVYRRRTPEGEYTQDTLVLLGEKPEGAPLLVPAMKSGKRLAPPVPLARIRNRLLTELRHLPAVLRKLEKSPEPYPVVISQAVRDLAQRLDFEQARLASGSKRAA